VNKIPVWFKIPLKVNRSAAWLVHGQARCHLTSRLPALARMALAT
jgi:hypothetical protein